MGESTIDLDESSKNVLDQVRQQKAMPFLEIAAMTGVRGRDLEKAIGALERRKLVTVSKPNDLFSSIVSINGKLS